LEVAVMGHETPSIDAVVLANVQTTTASELPTAHSSRTLVLNVRSMCPASARPHRFAAAAVGAHRTPIVCDRSPRHE
jgi:hypothetical protein